MRRREECRESEEERVGEGEGKMRIDYLKEYPSHRPRLLRLRTE